MTNPDPILAKRTRDVVLAPMAGITDAAFRKIAVAFGADWAVSEMVAARGWQSGQAEMHSRAALGDEAAPTVVQIAGCEPEPMAEMARALVAQGAARIDINMGCPAKKVTKQGKASGASGSALMRVPDHALRLMDAVLAAVPVPVSVKMRLGWDHDSLNAPHLAAEAAALGIARVAVHGRTRQQFYKGRADWAAVADTVRSVAVPVLVNGDITSIREAQAALDQSGAAGVMVGRGAVGQPWVLGQIKAALAGQPVPEPPRGPRLADLVCGHIEAALALHGSDIGLRSVRKHLAGYAQSAQLDPAERQALLTETCPKRALVLAQAAFAAAAGPAQIGEAA